MDLKNNNCNVVFSNWVSCRKVSQSFSRHWSSWKDRYCILYNDTRMVLKTTSSNGLTSLHVLVRECRQHHYAADHAYVLALKCILPATLPPSSSAAAAAAAMYGTFSKTLQQATSATSSSSSSSKNNANHNNDFNSTVGHGSSDNSGSASGVASTAVTTELFFRFTSAAAMLLFEECVSRVLVMEDRRVQAFATEGLYMLKEYLHALPMARAFPWQCNRDRDWTLWSSSSSSSSPQPPPLHDGDHGDANECESGGTQKNWEGQDIETPALPIAPIISPRFAHKHGSHDPKTSQAQQQGVEYGSLMLHQSGMHFIARRSAVFDEISLHDGGPSPPPARPPPSSLQQQQPVKGCTAATGGRNRGPGATDLMFKRQQSRLHLLNMTRITVPPLNILLLAVGTRGDVSPFAMLGQRLQRECGHRVRLATHECFRDYVLSQGLDFYPLAGDPVKLSEFMVRSQGCLVPTTPALMREVPKNFQMTVEIMRSCWAACINASEMPVNLGADKDTDDLSFCANAIISNPVSYGHIHCAEALGIPLHLMFPQPWVPTKAFPHPLSCFSYSNGWCSDNTISYQMVEQVMWLSLEAEINEFRVRTLNLPPIRRGEHGWDRLNYNCVPFVEMWSPALAPRPKDWGDHVQVSGFFFDQPPVVAAAVAVTAEVPTTTTTGVTLMTSTEKDASKPPATTTGEYTPSEELHEFLFGPKHQVEEEEIAEQDAAGGALGAGGATVAEGLRTSPRLRPSPPPPPPPPAAPIFIGFGSMVMDSDTEAMLSTILEAAALAGVRVLYQTGWSSASQETFKRLARAAEANARLIREADLDIDVDGIDVDDDEWRDVASPSRNRNKIHQERNRQEEPQEPQRRYSQLEIYSSALYKRLSYATKATTGLASSYINQAGKSALVQSSKAAVGSAVGSVRHSVVSATADSLNYVRSSLSGANDAVEAGVGAGVDYLGLQSAVDYLHPSSTTGHVSSGYGVSGGVSSMVGGGHGRDVYASATFPADAAAYELSALPLPPPPPPPSTAVEASPLSPPPLFPSLDTTTATTTLPAAAAAPTDSVNTSSIVLPPSCDMHWSADRDALMIGPCPHSWLFDHVGAVVHHGGAGTTSAGLRAGKPTMVCPFFGDQFFWGEMVHARGFGPKPCSVGKLTVARLVHAFSVLLEDKTQQAVNTLASVLQQEDGVAVGLELFHEQLPLTNMLCDVSLFLPKEYLRGQKSNNGNVDSNNSNARDNSNSSNSNQASCVLARVYCSTCGMKMSAEVCEIVHRRRRDTDSVSSRQQARGHGRDVWNPNPNPNADHSYSYYDYVTWDTLHPANAADGVWQGLAGGLQELVGGLKDVFTEPITTMYTDGVSAASFRHGVTKGITSLISRPAKATQVFVSKVQEGARMSFGGLVDPLQAQQQQLPQIMRPPPRLMQQPPRPADAASAGSGSGAGVGIGPTVVQTPELPDSVCISRATSDGNTVNIGSDGDGDGDNSEATPDHYLSHSQLSATDVRQQMTQQQQQQPTLTASDSLLEPAEGAVSTRMNTTDINTEVPFSMRLSPRDENAHTMQVVAASVSTTGSATLPEFGSGSTSHAVSNFRPSSCALVDQDNELESPHLSDMESEDDQGDTFSSVDAGSVGLNMDMGVDGFGADMSMCESMYMSRPRVEQQQAEEQEQDQEQEQEQEQRQEEMIARVQRTEAAVLTAFARAQEVRSLMIAIKHGVYGNCSNCNSDGGIPGGGAAAGSDSGFAGMMGTGGSTGKLTTDTSRASMTVTVAELTSLMQQLAYFVMTADGVSTGIDSVGGSAGDRLGGQSSVSGVTALRLYVCELLQQYTHSATPTTSVPVDEGVIAESEPEISDKDGNEQDEFCWEGGPEEEDVDANTTPVAVAQLLQSRQASDVVLRMIEIITHTTVTRGSNDSNNNMDANSRSGTQQRLWLGHRKDVSCINLSTTATANATVMSRNGTGSSTSNSYRSPPKIDFVSFAVFLMSQI